ncbi:MAG TPA: cytochrome P450 [Solirubrobacteraceae bacterium]|nr:cytochrome P450 [Solirubrobacteraceae bacterium]
MTRTIADLPSPPGLPALGNAHQLRISKLHSTAERWAESYGPIFRFDLGPRRVVVIDDVEAIGACVRDRPDGFRRWSEIGEDYAGTGFAGVFDAEGDDWRRSRRLVVTALNSNHLQRYFHVVRTATGRLHGRLREEVHGGGGESLDITALLTSFTVDVTSALAFGHDLNTLQRGDGELQRHIQRVFETSGRRLVKPVPYWRWVRLPADRAYDRSLAEIHRAVEGFIAQARERIARRPELREQPENFLESMLVAQELDGKFSDEEIIGNTFTLLLAGEDTTAHTMAWTTWALGALPEIQERWAIEAREVLGEGRYPDAYETIEQLRYGEAVLRESMRLKPVAPMMGLEPLHDTTICDTLIPAGTRMLLLTRRASKRSGGFGQPEEFDPDRWLEDDEGEGTRDPKNFLAFGGGPRFCPGRNLAFLESKCAMSMIARNFEIEPDERHAPDERFAFTMIPYGLRVRLRERAPSRRPASVGEPLPVA